MRKFLICLCVSALLWPVAARADGFDDVKEYTQKLIDSAIVDIFNKDNDADKRISRFRVVLNDNFDFAYISNFVLGVYARGATEIAKRKFAESFSELNVYSYAKKFDRYENQTINVVEATEAKKKGEFFVESKVVSGDPADKDMQVMWRVQESDAGYKVVDVVIEGVSMAMSYKNEYAPALKAASDEGLAPVMELTKKIDGKVAALKSGKPAPIGAGPS